MDDYDLESTLDFGDMEDIGEEDSIEPIDESDSLQELDENGNQEDKSNQTSDSPEEGSAPYENLNSESTSTVLVSDQVQVEDENLLNDAQGSEEIEEINQDELSKEIEEELQEGIEAINQNLEKEADFINAYKEMVENARELDRERASEGEEPLQTEEEWDKEVENAAYDAEQLYGDTKGTEVDAIPEEITEINEQQIDDPIEKPVEATQEDLDLEDLEVNEIEQHQVEPFIEEALETEPEPMINDKEVEQLQELDLQDQFQEVQFKEYIEDIVENQNEITEPEIEEEVEDQIDISNEESAEGLREDLDIDDLEVNEIEQHQVEPLIEEALETELEPTVNDKELEQLQELDLEEQFQKVHFTDYIKDLGENQNEKLEQENKKEIEIQADSFKEKLYDLQEEIEEEKDEIEQHQVESVMEELLETEPDPIVSEKELENLREMELEEQFQKVQFKEFIEDLVEQQNEEKEKSEEKEESLKISTDREVVQESSESEIDKEISSEMHTGVESNDHLQELEEILEQNSRIEQEALNETEPEKEYSEKNDKENYEEAKKLYTQQTGKRSIYANKETKGFLQWLEQRKESKTKQKEKEKEKKELKKEQKKDETWKWTLNNMIEEATEIEPEIKSLLKKLVEKYDKLEELIKKYSQLYLKAQRYELSLAEKNELNALIITLQKFDKIKITMLFSIQEIKRYIDEQYYHDFWNKQRHYQVFSNFFTHLSQQYKRLRQAQKENERSEEILIKWIENAPQKEISINMKSKLREIVANYGELDAISTKFMELYNKSKKKQISKKEKSELKSLKKILGKLEPSIIQMFSKFRAIKKYINDHNVNQNDKNAYRIFSHFFTKLERITISPLFNLNFEPLTSEEIIEREVKYQKILEELCVQYALEFKGLILKEYGKNIMEMNIPLSSHFGFRLDKYIRKVSHIKRDRAVGVGILERIRTHIIKEYNKWDKNWVKEASLKKILSFIEEYKEFSLYVSGKSGQGMFSISNIRYEQNSKMLAPKSWLIENLRYLFPKKFGLPLHDNLLSWLIFGDTPSYGRVTKLKWTMDNREVSTRMYLSELLAIDYRVNKLTKDAFIDKRLKISDKNYELLKASVSFLVYYYIFGGYHDSTYVSETTSKGLDVGRKFFTIEYEVIRAIFFAAAESNRGEPVNFEVIQTDSSSEDLKSHLQEGFGFGEDFNRLLDYFSNLCKNRPIDSNFLIFREAKEVLERYHDAYRKKYREFQKTRDHATKYQGKVHLFSQDFLGLKLASEEQVRAVVKAEYVTVLNNNGVEEKIHVHHAFKFDCYIDLTRSLKKYLSFDDKWMGLAIEANGIYWHNLPAKIEADRKKRLICRQKNIILVEIWEDWNSNTWGNEIIDQIKKQTGVEILRSKLGDLSKYLGV